MVLTHVERVLRQSCRPGDHHFDEDANSFDFERCRTCARRQRIDGATCIVCTAAGAGHYTLVNESTAAAIAGRLCPECGAEFAFRGAVQDWAIRVVVAA